VEEGGAHDDFLSERVAVEGDFKVVGVGGGAVAHYGFGLVGGELAGCGHVAFFEGDAEI